MAQQTQFTIGARASFADHLCGVVRRIIIDPASRTVTHLVIERKHLRQPGRLVPLDLVDTAVGEIRLRCTVAEFDRLDPAEEWELVRSPRSTRGMVGMTTYTWIPPPTRFAVHEIVPAGEAQVGPGDRVCAIDGEIGQVRGLLVDPGDLRVTHVLLREGHLRGRRRVAIPVSAVIAVQDGILLNITKQQAENLPLARSDHG
ncbi:MAG: hypothetical protein ACRDOB_10385 [Streptosporangiaceae bacterium]